MLDRSRVRSFYDRFGALQDAQAFYEDAALETLIAHAGFEDAKRVFELGCGTGRLARRLLEERLPASSTYVGVDLSATMVGIARRRLAPFAPRVEVLLTGGEPVVEGRAGSMDRVVSTYVLDLLPEAEIVAFIGDAARAVVAGGRICLVSLTNGIASLSRWLTAGWKSLHHIAPQLVGGCRPIELLDYLPTSAWQLMHRGVVVDWGVPSEVVVAERAREAGELAPAGTRLI